MQLDTYTPPSSDDGDRLPAKEMAGRPLIVAVREHRTGIKTAFNSNPADPAKYKPEGGDAIGLDVADLSTNAIYLGVLWFNGAIVDGLRPYVGQTLPVKLVFTAAKGGGNAYLAPEPLDGAELAAARGWAASNPTRFETERASRAANGIPPIPGAPDAPPAWAAPVNHTATPPLAYTAATTTQVPVATPAYAPPAAAQPSYVAPAATPTYDPNDPAVQALLAQIANGQIPVPPA
jgi:hypothetical protein